MIGRLHSVGSPFEAIAYLRRDAPYFAAPRPDVLLLGHALPESCGCDFESEVRKNPELRELRMFLIADDPTGSASVTSSPECCDLPSIRLADLAKIIAGLGARPEESWRLRREF